VVRQERNFLQANAAAVARQAAAFFSPSLRRVPAGPRRASAFLGNARCACSTRRARCSPIRATPPPPTSSSGWCPRPREADERSRPSAPLIIPSLGWRPQHDAGMRDLLPFSRPAPRHNALYASRQFTSWGRRFSFENQRPNTRRPAVRRTAHYLTVTEPVGPPGPAGWWSCPAPLVPARDHGDARRRGGLLGPRRARRGRRARLVMGRTLADPSGPCRGPPHAWARATWPRARPPASRRDRRPGAELHAMAGSLEAASRARRGTGLAAQVRGGRFARAAHSHHRALDLHGASPGRRPATRRRAGSSRSGRLQLDSCAGSSRTCWTSRGSTRASRSSRWRRTTRATCSPGRRQATAGRRSARASRWRSGGRATAHARVRPAAGGARTVEPRVQCREVHPARRPHRGIRGRSTRRRGRSRRRPREVHRARQRPGHRGGRAAPDLRAVLPRPQRHGRGAGLGWPSPAASPSPTAAACRGERAGSGKRVPPRPARSSSRARRA